MKIMFLLLSSLPLLPLAAQDFEVDHIKTANDSVAITFIGHGSLMMEYGDQIIHIDPSSQEADYANLPDANLILITHHHGDHCDPKAFNEINTSNTATYLTQLCYDKLDTGKVLESGQSINYKDIKIEVLPAYNLVHKRDNGDFFHPKGCCNGYVLNIDGKRIFVAGDTENTPEMKALKDIDIAFLPMNLPYTMTPEMVADAAKSFQPKVLYPYHYGDTDVNNLLELMKEDKSIEVRVREMR